MTDFAAGEQLAQVRPANTDVAVAYTAEITTEITLVVVCNTTTNPADFSVFHDDAGNNQFAKNTALYYTERVPAGSTKFIQSSTLGAGITVKRGGQIGVQSSVANALTFTLYGVTESLYGASHSMA